MQIPFSYSFHWFMLSSSLLLTPLQANLFMEKQESPLNRHDIDQLNQKCYDHQYYLWDRFPFEDTLPSLVRQYTPQNLGNKVLDIGSGTGRLASWLKTQGFDVQGIDPSLKMVQLCREKGINCAQITLQDYQTEEKFAMVFAILSLIHVPKQEAALQLQKMSQWLKPGGILFLALIEGNTQGIEETHSPYPRFFAKYTTADVQKLTSQWFHVMEVYEFKGPVTYLLFVLKQKASS